MNRPVSLIVLAAFALASAGCGSRTTYFVKVEGYKVANPAELDVTVQVTNTGPTAGTPQCAIRASDASEAYGGVDVVTLQKPVPAGATKVFVDDVTITNQGAQYVTLVLVNCS